jgi:acetyl esterase
VDGRGCGKVDNDHAAGQGVDPAKIGVGADPAAGNMTCVMASKLRDENGPRLAVQVPAS